MTVVVERIYRTRAETQKPEADTQSPDSVDRLIGSLDMTHEAAIRQSLVPLSSHTWFSPENYGRVMKWSAAALASFGSGKKSATALEGMQFLIAAMVDCYHNDRALYAASRVPGNPAPQRIDTIPIQIQHARDVYTRQDSTLVWSATTPVQAVSQVADLVAGGMPDRFLVSTYVRSPNYSRGYYNPSSYDPIIFAQYGNWVVKVAEWE